MAKMDVDVVARDVSSAAIITAVDEAWADPVDRVDLHDEVDTVANIRMITIRMDRNNHAVCHRDAVAVVLVFHVAEDEVARGHGMT